MATIIECDTKAFCHSGLASEFLDLNNLERGAFGKTAVANDVIEDAFGERENRHMRCLMNYGRIESEFLKLEILRRKRV
jgi:hypothetical protein